MTALHKTTIALLATLLLAAGSFAQDTTTTQEQPAQNPSSSAPMGRQMRRDPVAARMQMISRRLNLTEDQKTQIQPILQNQMQQMRIVRQDSSLTPEQQRQQMQQIRQRSQEQIKQLLTPEQVAQLGSGPGPHGARGNPVEMMSQRLNLTDDQKAKLQPLFADQQKQVQAVQQDSSLTPEQKQAKIRDLRKTTHQQMIGVLTPEQQAQWKQMMRNARMHRRGAPAAQPAPQATPQATPQGL